MRTVARYGRLSYCEAMGTGRDRPLAVGAGCAAGAYLAAVGAQVASGGHVEITLRALVVAIAGAVYTNLFEHLWHRYGMHVRRDARHARHHRIFYGSRFQSSERAVLGEIATSWYLFPVLLAIHYPTFCLLFGSGYAPAFFLGVVLHFVAYEATHWYTHVADNGFDRAVARIPGLRRLRAEQIRHHRMHHVEPMINFNFNPPYAGDRLARVFRR